MVVRFGASGALLHKCAPLNRVARQCRPYWTSHLTLTSQLHCLFSCPKEDAFGVIPQGTVGAKYDLQRVPGERVTESSMARLEAPRYRFRRCW